MSKTNRTMLLALAFGTAVGPSWASFRFSEVQDEAGIRFDYHRDAYVAFGAGGTWLDFDRDGWTDLYLTQMVGANRLFRNLGDGTFAEVTEAAGAADVDGFAYGSVAADYDNDGDPDLYVTNNGQNRLFRNQLVETGVAGFVDATVEAGMIGDGRSFSTSASFGDFDGDGWLDLYVANYAVEFRGDNLEEKGTPNLLWHNQGDGTFRSVGARYGAARGIPNTRDGLFVQPGATLATTFSDFDNDGDADILIINDFGMTVHPAQLLRNDGPDGDGGWIFTDVSMESGFDVRILGMGIGVGDIDRDGDLDYYASNGPHNVMLRNRLDSGELGFDEIAAEAGVEAYDPSRYGPAVGPISWGCDFADFDSDGWVDLLVVNGFLDISRGSTSPYQPVFVYRNEGDLTFTELHDISGLTEDELAGKSSGFADYDRDGDVDFFVGSIFRWNPATDAPEPAWYRLYRNDTRHEHHWLRVTAEGTLSNRDSIGARIALRADGGAPQVREIGTGRSFLASSELAQHFGLGTVDRVDALTVRWPSGVSFTERQLGVDRDWHFVEPTVQAYATTPRTEYRASEVVRLDYQLENRLAETQQSDLWVDYLDTDGQPTSLRALADVVIAPSSLTEGSIALDLPAGLTPGEHTLALRWGRFPDTVSQQFFVDLTVSQ